jgi:hypothetical protein
MESVTIEEVQPSEMCLYFSWKMGTTILDDGTPAVLLVLIDGETQERQSYLMHATQARELADRLRSEAADVTARRLDPPV